MQEKTKNAILIVAGIIAAILVIVLGVFLFNTFLGSPPPVVATETVVADDSLQRVRGAGRLVVGTSADYPPFAYYNASGQIDGFDAALIRLLGQKMGVQVQVQDFAFDGLGAALTVRQIDAAIAAISVTPEREAVVEFSSVYFASQEGILSKEGSPIGSISSIGEMAPYRVGVQDISVYETWLRTNLVDTGNMPEANIFVYPRIDTAVTDLRDGRIDLVVMDLLPAQSYASQGALEIVGQGLSTQSYAIALPNGAFALQAEFNRLLVELQAEGTLAELYSRYGLTGSGITPLPTPTPGPVPTPPTACVDGLELIQDLNLDDRDMTAPPVLPAGQPFTKGWRIRNTGTCPWSGSYQLIFVQGNTPEARMGGLPTPVQGQVLANQSYDMYINLVAPLKPGIYQAIWQMVNDKGIPFGQRLNVGIQVLPNATATPLPTQTPSPSISFSADRTLVNAGEPVVFTWDVQGAREVYFYQQGYSWQQFPVPARGSSTVYPAYTTTYELRVVYLNGAVEIRQIQVQVTQAPGAPVIYRFTAEPRTINAGGCVNLQWEVQGQVNAVRLLRDGAVVWDGAPAIATFQDCPPGVGDKAYTLEAGGPGGTSRLQRVVTVAEAVETQPPPTSVPAPVIDQFAVAPAEIQAGECVDVAWSVSGGADMVRILIDGSVVLDDAPFHGSGTDCPDVSGTITYRVEASSTSGQTASEERAVLVQASPQNPLVGSQWLLRHYYDGVGAMVAVLPGTEIRLVFESESDLTGFAGCNDYNAEYEAAGETLRVADLLSNTAACAQPEGAMEQEARYLALLESSAFYRNHGVNILEILDPDRQVVLQLENMRQPR